LNRERATVIYCPDVPPERKSADIRENKRKKKGGTWRKNQEP